MKKTILLSGGIDSATALALSKKVKSDEITSAIHIYFSIGNSESSLASARRISRQYSTPLEVLDLSQIAKSFIGLSLGNQPALGLAMSGTTRSLNCPIGVFGIASNYSMALESFRMITGVNKNDLKGVIGNPVKKFEEYGCSAEHINKERFRLENPFLNKTKEEVISIAKEIGVDIDNTHSCYVSNIPCGKCKGCLEREAALHN